MESNLSQLWNTCLSVIESQLSKATFSTWFKNTGIAREEEGIIYISVPNEFVREWLMTKFHKIILKSIVDNAPHVRAIEFVISSLPQTPAAPAPAQSLFTQPTDQPSSNSNSLNILINRDDNLNPRYTFENFVVGPFNELAYAAAQAIVKRPQHAYNPLFIYGNSGLGKTHLIQAIGNEIKRTSPEKRVLYTSLEKFMNEYVSSVQNNRQQAFQDKYRKFDVLIMDDIQFISGKEGTQHALFHIFNTLHDLNKNIIFSSDKHPNHIIGLEDRLKTRFNAGMTIDVQEPDLESRLAIIKEKTAVIEFPIEPEVISYIATAVTGSIRELEGVLNLIAMHSGVRQKAISLAEIKLLIKNSIRPKRVISIDSVVKMVSDYYNLDEQVIYEKTRRKEIVRARQIIMFVLREDFNESYPSIGAKLGGKDHTTVIHSYEKIKGELTTDPHLMKELEDIRILFK
ncbi:MAG: chromosomal replication initiator protein DnaA [Patescibacteria group bacterium]